MFVAVESVVCITNIRIDAVHAFYQLTIYKVVLCHSNTGKEQKAYRQHKPRKDNISHID
jgi:hypothetical protein